MVILKYETRKHILTEIVQYIIEKKINQGIKFTLCGVDEDGKGRIILKGVPKERVFLVNKEISTYIAIAEHINDQYRCHMDQVKFIMDKKSLRKIL